jgi:hypothetical protein
MTAEQFELMFAVCGVAYATAAGFGITKLGDSRVQRKFESMRWLFAVGLIGGALALAASFAGI